MRGILSRSILMPLSCLTVSASSLITYGMLYSSGKNELYWLTTGLVSGLLMPYTAKMIFPVNQQFRDVEGGISKGLNWTVLLEKWQTLNRPRAAVMGILFCVGVYKLATDR